MKEEVPNENERPKIEGFVYDEKYRQFPQVIEYRGRTYDARDSSGDTCVYRMTSESRMQLSEPDYIKVDHAGYVVWESDDKA